MKQDFLQDKLEALLDQAQSGLRNTEQAKIIAQRWPFEIDGKMVGTVLESDAKLLERAIPGLVIEEACLMVSPVCAKDSAPVLEQIARTLQAAQRISHWRGELLAVHADDGSQLGVIERAAMRVLGLRTSATHLVGLRTDGRYWLQQRAFTKETDPGRWDTLAGGLVGTTVVNGIRQQENLRLATWREAQEEAGVPSTMLGQMHALPTMRMNCLVSQGYMLEDVYAYSALLPDHYQPINHDGEVASFGHFSREQVLEMIAGDQVALEPAIVMLQLLKAH